MCGIAGVWSKTGKPVDKDLLSLMQFRLKHRGPDAEGILIRDNLGFAHSRLKILDLSNDANQPFTDGKDVLVFNGEIFNYKELKKELPSFQFRTSSDTEVLFRALQKWGVSALEKISGQFAFIFYNRAHSTLLIARDHVGICPLYTCDTDDYLYIASEIRPLLEVKKFPLDSQGVIDYFAYRYNIQNGLTLFEGISRFAPSHYWKIDLKDRSIKKNRYWRLKFSDNDCRIEESQDIFNQILDGEIASQSVADVPVGIYLSGGIDSRALLFGFSKNVSEIDSFTIRFDKDDPDVKLVNNLEKEICFNKKLLSFTPDLFDDIEDIVLSLEEPFGDLIICANYFLPKNAAQMLKVVLSGEGGDEAFMGYDHQRAYMRMNNIGSSAILSYFARIMLSICSPQLLSMFNSYPGAFGLEEHARIKQVFEKINSPCDAYIRLISLYDDTEIPKLFDRSFLSHAPSGPDRNTLRETFFQDQHVWQSVMRLEIEQLTLIVNLLKQDRFSMRFSIEGRVPLVSRSVLDFASTLPVEQLLHKINKKYLLNYSNSKPLAKRAFSIFVSPIYAKILIDLMEKYVNRASIEECGILSWETANLIREGLKKGGMLAVKKAMAIVVFMIWWKVFRVYIK